MIARLLTGILTTIFAELILILYQNDLITDFIPISDTLQNGRLAAYDLFLIFTILIAKIIFNHFGITISFLKQFLASFRNIQLIEIAIIVTGALITHFFICPFLYSIFYDPIRVIASSPSSIRRAILFQIPLLWIFTISIINSRFNSYSSYSGGNNTPNLPPIPQPPNWP